MIQIQYSIVYTTDTRRYHTVYSTLSFCFAQSRIITRTREPKLLHRRRRRCRKKRVRPPADVARREAASRRPERAWQGGAYATTTTSEEASRWIQEGWKRRQQGQRGLRQNGCDVEARQDLESATSKKDWVLDHGKKFKVCCKVMDPKYWNIKYVILYDIQIQ